MQIEAPLSLHTASVQPEWIDYNGHMNLAYYVLVFDHATDAFLDYIGITETFRKAEQSSTFAAEIHVTYEQEVTLDAELVVKTRLLGFDAKRIHYFHWMYDRARGSLVATNELLSLYMNMQERRVSAMPGAIQARLGDIFAAHGSLPVPAQAGRRIGLKHRS